MHNASDEQDNNDGPTEPRGTVYRMPIWDPSLPAFASGVAYVYGTGDDIRNFIGVRQSMHHDKGDNVVDAYEAWCASKFDEIPVISIAYKDRPFVSECPVIGGVTRGVIRDYDETYVNIWGFPYEVHIDDGTYARMLLQDEGKYVIIEKASVRGMTLDAPVSGRMPVSSSWGELGIVDIEAAGILKTTMFLVAGTYDDESVALDALNRDVPLSIEALMNQIVADG